MASWFMQPELIDARMRDAGKVEMGAGFRGLPEPRVRDSLAIWRTAGIDPTASSARHKRLPERGHSVTRGCNQTNRDTSRCVASP